MSDFLTFVGRLGVMKPATIDETNQNHLKRIEEILHSADYMAEEKIDGCHYMTIGARFFSTEAIEKTNNYPHLRDFFIHMNMPNLILDGEINYPGRTSQYCTKVTGASPDTAIAFQNDTSPIHYTMWDMLRTPRGTWLLNEPLWKRRKILEEFYARFIKGTSLEQYIHLTDYRTTDKKQYYEELLMEGKEGVVLKRLDSMYIMGKKPMWQWMKLKQKDTADLFITGYDAPTMKYSGLNVDNWAYWREIDGILQPVTKYYYMNWIGALELSAFVNGEVRKVCTCSGISEQMREEISLNKQQYMNRVVKISYMEKTEAGIPRHPRFEQFHESKLAKECIWELYE
jgi:ATP-dependent DNA ligase